MSAHDIRRKGERQAWFDLSCILGHDMEGLGWEKYSLALGKVAVSGPPSALTVAPDVLKGLFL